LPSSRPWDGEDGQVAIIHGTQDALRLRLGVEIELVMDGADGEVEPLQRRLLKVEPAVRQDVDFRRFEDQNAFVIEEHLR